MFLRVSKGKSRNYVVIVRGYRDQEGKPKQKTIKNLGSFRNEEEKEKLYKIGLRIIDTMESQQESIIIAKEESLITELSRYNWASSLILDKLFKRFKLDAKLSLLMKDRKAKFDLSAHLKFLIANRLVAPSSKLAAYSRRDKLWARSDEISLHNLYRSLDELARSEYSIKNHLFKSTQKLIDNQIEIVLFDVTTLYFESKEADELKNFGYSKDCKFSEVQIVLSMMVDLNGRPLSYEIFSGNMFEGNTLVSSINQLKDQYNIKKVTIVADRGMSSIGNLETIREAGFDFCISFRLRSTSAKLQKEILKDEDYNSEYSTEDEIIKYKIIDNNENSLLCLYSSKRAIKDRLDREKLLEKAEMMLENGSYKRKSGAKKYLKIEEHKATNVLYDKAANDARFDGYYAISFSNKKAKVNEVIEAYHGLWKIEASFRSMKHFLQARPMFHWSKERIKGHIALNFISLIFERDLELGTNLTQNRIRDAIYNMQASRLKIDQTELLCHSELSQEQENILKYLKITKPANKVVNSSQS
ncbi:MAG: IS1634 family transposase [Rickettsiaceae bacterium]|nr:IS1634 family transposase [Rickettsiaceae bacterium]